ncbi:MAG: GGDEF domain-containing phosphodiesterase [Lachnospiraceae bacterium]|nr:GGDEF domain-containing phosphodiesterase [Lachnospiraceae bacterium]
MGYYELFERYVRDISVLRESNKVDTKLIGGSLMEFINMFRVSKVTATFYEDSKEERFGRGEILRYYDSGEDSVVVSSERHKTGGMGIAVIRLYQSVDAEPWSEEERARAHTIQDVTLAYTGCVRMSQIVDRLTFYDEEGYRNLKYYLRHNQEMVEKGQCINKAAIHFNLRHFSLVNQQVGRSVGNFVMRSFYDQLQALLGDKGLVCRVGGDNFVSICDKEILDEVLEYLSGTPICYNMSTGDKVMVSASTGVYLIPDDFDPKRIDSVMDKIIPASNNARVRGEDVVFFNTDMEENKEKIAMIQQLFPVAIRAEEFRVFYQPKIDVKTGKIVGAEALCRWFRDGKIVPPADFIPILELSTDICKLDFYMLEHVCKDIRRWLDEGKNVVRVSVNLSRKHMMDIDLLEHIIEIADRYSVPHNYIEIELTETTTDVEFKDLKRVVSGLQRVGICTSVDDFGIGYSSLNLIRDIPWNVLKVDKSFLPVEGDGENSIRSIMFKYVVAMAREMGLECIAEGVETEKQVEVLKQNSCEIAQGFYYDKPLPVNEYEKRIFEEQ